MFYCFDADGTLVEVFRDLIDACGYCRDHPGCEYGYVAPFSAVKLQQIVDRKGESLSPTEPTTTEDETLAMRLWDEFHAAGLSGSPRFINSPEKARFFIMHGYEKCVLMTKYLRVWLQLRNRA